MADTYDVNHLVTVGELKQTAQAFKLETDKAIKSASVQGNTISLFTTEDGSGTAAYTIDFPKDFLLDQAKTLFVPNFTFSAATYPGAVNPSLDGKPVFVLAVKGTTDVASGTANDTVNYSFMDMSALVDTYSVKAGDSEKILTISGYEIEFKISSESNNAIIVKNDGIYVDISGKTDKPATATTDNVAVFDANRNPIDSGIAKDNIVQKSDIATTAEITAMLSDIGLGV